MRNYETSLPRVDVLLQATPPEAIVNFKISMDEMRELPIGAINYGPRLEAWIAATARVVEVLIDQEQTHG